MKQIVLLVLLGEDVLLNFDNKNDWREDMERNSIKISIDTNQVLEFLDYVSSNSLRSRYELGAILEVGAQNGMPDETDDLIFSGKLLDNILNLRSNTKEFETALFSFQSKLADFASATHSEPLAEIVSGLKQSEQLLINLAHDMARLKDVQIKIQREDAQGVVH